MLQKLLNNYHLKLSSNKYIIKFAKLVSAEDLWHFHRESVAKGTALGIACSWIPLPFHTVIAIILAIIVDCNIPLAAVAIWFANPITMPFMYYLAYQLGANILNVHMVYIHFHLNIHYILQILHEIWQPFLLGCLICGLVSGVLTYLLINMFWPDIDDKIKPPSLD